MVIKNIFKDVLYHGCVSGMVSEVFANNGVLQEIP